MSTNVMSASYHSIDSSHLSSLQTDLELQNDQLWSIITQQKNVIRDLESALARMTKDRDLLLLRTTATTATPASLPSPLTCSQEPVPPPRSPYRQRSHNGNTNVDITETINRSRSSSSTTDDAPTTGKAGGSVHAIVGKDAELFANYQKTTKGLTPSSSLSSGVDDSDDGDYDDDDEDKESNKLNSNSHNEENDDSVYNTTTSATAPLTPPKSPSQQTRGALVIAATDLDTENYASFCTTMVLKVLDIHLQHISKHKETISFIISVSRHSNSDVNTQQELWRIKKGYSEFMALDTLLRSRLRSVSNKNDIMAFKMGKLPAKSLFTATKSANTTMDQKKRVIERYMANVTQLPLPETMDLIQFLSSGILEQKEWSTTPKQTKCEKEGYVSLYGKQSKKWHPYYFMLYGSTLNYYEDDSKDGHLIGSLLLKDCQMTVHRSSTPGLFYHISSRSTITLLQRSSSSASKHAQYLLRMTSDTELDEWVQALSPVTQPAPQVSRSECLATSKAAHGSSSLKGSSGSGSSSSRKRLSNRILPSTKHAPPQRSQSDNSVGSLMPSITTALDTCRQQQKQRKRSSIDAIFYSTRRPTQPQAPQESQSTRHTPSISALLPSASTSLLTRRYANDASTATATKKATTATATAAPATKLNRRTFWPKSMFLGQGHDSHGLRGFLARHASDHHLSSTSPTPALSSTTNTCRTSTSPMVTTSTTTIKRSAPPQESRSINAPTHPCFGVPLERALLVSKTHGLPSIVYRCIQFLERKKAIYEEGIYRISGSTIKIKGLRRRFDEQGDIDLLALEEFRDCDIHAVSGLLKLWLRELPGHILTDRLIDSFILVKDARDRHDCLNKLSRLIAKLPSANYALLRALMAHLHYVTRNANVNKMTLKNMAIVFSPTLAIPTSIFDLFLSEFDKLFMSRKRQQQQQPRSLAPTDNKDHDISPSMSAERRLTVSNSSRQQKKVDKQSGIDQDEGDNNMVKTEGMGLLALDPPKPMIKT